MTKHTPGPWVVTNGYQVWKDGRNALLSPRICSLKSAATPVEQVSRDEMAANAALIAAAPDMLAALREAVQAHGPFGDDSRPAWWQAACDAIARAEGSL